MSLPTGTVTLLLADVEGSVRLWEADRAAMRTAMKALEELADEAVQEHGGARPVEQGEGDNLVAAFVRASDAVACAVGIQTATERASDAVRPRFRMAVHTGEVELRDEGRYDGETVNRCARLRDSGHGGQVLLSRTTHDLVADRLPDGVTLTRLGTYRLRDMARPEEVYQVDHPDLGSTFPPLRTLGGPPNNLPRQLTSFIGREAEMAAVTEILTEARLLTLTGSGGCGKTRLGVQVAASLLDDYPDGVWWVDLARVSDPTLVAGALAVVLGVQEPLAASVAEAVRGHLSTSHSLLVLDNCEHLIEACAELAGGLLGSCPGVRILATSREPLGVLGEVAWRVPSLEVPEEGEANVASLSQCEAVRLFIDRALQVRPNFQVTNDNAPAVAEICSRLDGIPLAIELAASRTRMMTPDQIVAGLGDRFRLLTGSGRGLLPRHQTLRASVEWSYDLLGPGEQTMLDRLSVFRGSFTLDAAEDVCTGEGIERIQVLELLSDLVDRSLVQVEEEQREARYRLLETIRQYGAERLAGDEDEVRTRHLDHYVALAERAEPGLEGSELMDWLDRLDLELSNLRAAMDHGQRSGQQEKVLRIAAAAWKHWMIRGYITEGHARVEVAMEAPGIDPLVRARALVGVCQNAILEYSPTWALAFAEEALTLAREVGDERTVGRALATLGVTYGFRAVDTEATIDDAIEVCTRTGDALFLCTALHARFQQRVARGEIRSARRAAEEAVEHARATGDLHALSVMLGPYAWVLMAEACLDAARAAYAEGLELSRDLGNRPWEDWCLFGLASVAHLRGSYEHAAAVHDEVLSRSRMSGSLLPAYLMFKADLDLHRGELASAEEHADQVLGVARLIEWKLAIGRALTTKANVLIARGDLAAASALVDEALSIDLADVVADFWISPTQGRLLRAEGDHGRAEDVWHEALRSGFESGFRSELATTLEALAGLAAVAESDEEAARLFGAAEAERDRTGIVRPPIERRGYEADVALVRERMSTEDFDRAWEEGRAMSLEEAVAYASRGRGERKRPSAGWASLTPTELAIVELVAEGLTNPQIAERLFVARSTVKTHLSSIFRKLGVTTRSELATVATRRGIPEP